MCNWPSCVVKMAADGSFGIVGPVQKVRKYNKKPKIPVAGKSTGSVKTKLNQKQQVHSFIFAVFVITVMSLISSQLSVLELNSQGSA